jgi:hypothetical protein
MVMDEIMIEVTEGQESGIPKSMVYADDIVIWEPNASSLEKKFQRVVLVCKDFELNPNFVQVQFILLYRFHIYKQRVHIK